MPCFHTLLSHSPWNITAPQLDELLLKHRLISRPPFTGHGAVYHLKTTAEMLALADKAIANGGMEYLVIHGVERIIPKWSYQDFWALKQDVFLPLLDGLKARRDTGTLWIADHIAAHQYEREREAAAMQLLAATDRKISLRLTCQTDPQLYDQPLTLVTRVPAAWQQCRVTQGTNQFRRAATAGHELSYPAQPHGAPLTLEPAD